MKRLMLAVLVVIFLTGCATMAKKNACPEAVIRVASEGKNLGYVNN